MTLQSFKQQLVTEVFKCRGCYILKGVTTLCERLHIFPLGILLFSFPMTGVTKAMVCVILSVGWYI